MVNSRCIISTPQSKQELGQKADLYRSSGRIPRPATSASSIFCTVVSIERRSLARLLWLVSSSSSLLRPTTLCARQACTPRSQPPSWRLIASLCQAEHRRRFAAVSSPHTPARILLKVRVGATATAGHDAFRRRGASAPLPICKFTVDSFTNSRHRQCKWNLDNGQCQERMP